MSRIRRVVVNRGLLRVVQETSRDTETGHQPDVFHVELEGEGVLHSFGSLDMAMCELEAIVASDPSALDR